MEKYHYRISADVYSHRYDSGKKFSGNKVMYCETRLSNKEFKRRIQEEYYQGEDISLRNIRTKPYIAPSSYGEAPPISLAEATARFRETCERNASAIADYAANRALILEGLNLGTPTSGTLTNVTGLTDETGSGTVTFDQPNTVDILNSANARWNTYQEARRNLRRQRIANVARQESINNRQVETWNSLGPTMVAAPQASPALVAARRRRGFNG